MTLPTSPEEPGSPAEETSTGTPTLAAELSAWLQRVGSLMQHAGTVHFTDLAVFEKDGLGLPEVYCALHDLVGPEVQLQELVHRLDPKGTFVLIVSRSTEGKVQLKVKLTGSVTVLDLQLATVYRYPTSLVDQSSVQAAIAESRGRIARAG